MKLLACIVIFILGAIAGGWVMTKAIIYVLCYRADHPVDDHAVIRDDDYIKIVRLNKAARRDIAELVAVIHKDRI